MSKNDRQAKYEREWRRKNRSARKFRRSVHRYWQPLRQRAWWPGYPR